MKRFAQELEGLTAAIIDLSMVVDAAVRDAVRALEENRPELARRVIEGDAAIDREEVRIEEECIRILVLDTPVAGDLRRVIAALKINNDLERIADLGVDIAEQALALARSPGGFDIPGTLRVMADRALHMVGDGLNAFVGSDVMLARSVLAMDDEVDRLNRIIREEMEGMIRADPKRIDAAFGLTSVARHLERIADHATNIAEDVVYLRDGEIVRHLHEPGQGPAGPG